MSWLMIVVIVFVLVRLLSHRERGQLDCGPRRYRMRGFRSGGRELSATSVRPPAPLPDPRRDLQATIEAVRQEYVNGRITVEEYERRLDELYRTPAGRTLTKDE